MSIHTRQAFRMLKHAHQAHAKVSGATQYNTIAKWHVNNSNLTGSLHLPSRFPGVLVSQSHRYYSSETPKKPNEGKGDKESKDPVLPPSTSIEPARLSFETISEGTIDPAANLKSIEQVIAELNRDTRAVDTREHNEGYNNDNGSGHGNDGTGSASGSGPESDSTLPPPIPPKRKPSRFWYYLYYIILYSAIGSLPVHLLLTKGEIKELKEKQEWKIAVLTDMRDKLRRGESIEEEEALLSVGMDRSKREAQQTVDEAYFEDLLKSAEKLDFAFGSQATAHPSDATPTPVSKPAPPPPVVPRKPPPPKTEKSYL
ncbi:hypothetical protein BGZ94_008511 [Podila epigama]|nr:hypothetical protein BGZ94_008511 [Podila epigama]